MAVRHRTRVSARTRVVLALPAVVCLGATLAGWPLVVGASLLVAAAIPLRRRPRQWLAELPTAGLLLVAAVLTLAEGAPLLHLQPLSSAAAAKTTVVTLALVLLVWGQWRPLTADGLPDGNPSVLVRAPAAAMLLAGVVLAALPTRQGSGWFLRLDNIRHLMFVVEGHAAGVLEYSQQPYPRAWHSFVALLWTVSPHTEGAPGLLSLVHVASSTYWALYGLMVVACGVLAAEVCERVVPGGRWPAAAGVVAASLMLWPQFLAQLPLGFQTSVLATLALLVSLTELVRAPGGARAWLVVAAGTVVVAHTWQLILPVQGSLLLVATWFRLREARRGHERRQFWVLGLGWLSVAVLALPSVVAVFRSVGLQHASAYGFVPSGNWTAPVVMLAAAAPVLWVGRRRPVLMLVAAVAAALPLEAVALSVLLHTSVGSYYPFKLVCMGGVCATPVAVTLLCAALAGTGRTAAAGMRRSALVGVALLLCLCPFGPVMGLWEEGDASTVLSAATSPGADGGEVVWLRDDPTDSTTTRMLLDYYRAGSTLVRTPQEQLATAEECDLLRDAPAPTVISDASPDEVRARFGCVQHVAVIRARR